MAGYQIYTPIDYAPIDVNLFPNAMLAGAKASQMVPSTTQAVIQGALQGIQTGLNIYSGFQQIDLNAGRIRQQEAIADIAENQAAQPQLERANQTAQLNLETAANRQRVSDINLGITEQNAQAIGETQASQLGATKARADYQQQIFEQQQAFNNVLSGQDTNSQDIEDMLKSGNLALRDPSNGVALLNRYMEMPDIMNNPDKLEWASEQLQYLQSQAAQTANLARNHDTYDKQIRAFDASGDMSRLVVQADGRTPDQFRRDAVAIEKGKYKRVGDYWAIGPDGGPVEDKANAGAIKQGERTYEVAVPDNTGRMRIIGEIAPDQYTVFSAGKLAQSYTDGTSLNVRKQQIQERIARMRQQRDLSGSPGQVVIGRPQLGQTPAPGAATQPSTVTDSIAQKLNFTKQDVADSYYDFKRIESFATKYASDPNFRAQHVGAVPVDAGYNIARHAAKKIYDSRPDIQAQAEKDLAIWNKNRSFISPRYETAFDLYFSRQKDALLSEIDSTMYDFYQAHKDTSTSQARIIPVNQQMLQATAQ